jgi:hypothetical protein
MEFVFEEGSITDKIRAALSQYDNPKAQDFRDIAKALGTTYDTVRNVNYREKKKTVAVEIEGGESWEVKNGKYVWEAKHGLINLPVEFIDNLFFEYTTKGRNYTPRRICHKHKLEPWQFKSICNKLKLFKDSNVFSPYTWDNTPLDEREAMVAAKIRLKLEDTGHVLLEQHEKEISKAYKLEIEKGAKSKFFGDELKAQLLDHLPTIEKYRIARIPEPYKTDCIVATITDLHTGAQVEGLRATKDYNNEILRAKLKEVASIINEHGAKDVDVNILGDLIESFTGLNHANSWKSMQKGMYGVTVVKECYSIVLDFLCSINNLRSVNGVGGNHDRPTASNKEESNGEIAELIFFMLEQSLKTIKFTYDHSLNAQVIDGINYILVHGDKGHSKDNKIGTLVFNHGRQDMFNLVLAGHLHSRITGCDSSKYRKITVPSIFTGNQYSDDLGFNGTSGFLITYNRNSMPQITDYTLT